MSDVVIENVSSLFSQIGLINESSLNEFRINDNLALLIEDSINHNAELPQNEIAWNKNCFYSFLSKVYFKTM